MQTFGAVAERLSRTITDRERDLELLEIFKNEGGQHRIGLSCDHSNPEISAALARCFTQRRLPQIIMDGVIKVAAAEVDLAKEALRRHLSAHTMEV